MSKGLEALDNLLNDKLVKPDKHRKTIKDIVSVGQVAIITQELEEYEETKKDLTQVMADYQDLGNSVYKQLKVLEIIRKTCKFEFETKIVNKKVKVFRVHINGILTIDLETQEEYDLLKEVLC